MVVQHNMQAANANRMLGITVDSISKSTEKLSSGYRINRAADDAAGLSISEKMRKQIRGLTQASTNAQDGISAVQTAEGALTEVHSMLQRMNELSVQAANGTNSEIDRSAIQAEIEQLSTEIDRVSETTKFNETYLLKGDVAGNKAIAFSYQDAANKAVLGEDQELFYKDANGEYKQVEEGALLVSSSTYYTKSAKDIKTVGTKIDTASETSKFIDTSKKVTVITASNYYTKGDDGTYTLVAKNSKYDSTQTYYTAAGATGNFVDSNATAVQRTDLATDNSYCELKQAIYDSAGNLYEKGAIVASDIALENYYHAEKGALDAASFSAVLGSAAQTSFGDDNSLRFMNADGNEVADNGLYRYFEEDGTYKGGLYFKDVTGELKAASAAEIEEFVDTTTKEDRGSLKLSLHVGADATDNNKISIEISSMSADVLGVKDLDVSTEDSATRAIDTITAALQKVSEQRSALGAVQNRLEHTIANLDNVVENTTSAESRIRDVDMAEEMVTYSKNNILQQAGQSMLAQANQANQGVLSLLG